MTGAGQRRRRVTFQTPFEESDGAGNFTRGWVGEFTVWARVLPLKGGEAVIAGRLAGKQPVVINVLSSSDTRRITTDWRAVDARDETKIFNIRSVANMDEKNAELDILAEAGVAT